MVQSVTNYESNLEKLRTYERVRDNDLGGAGKEGTWSQVCYEIQSDRALVEVPFLLSMSKPRKWDGSKVLRGQVAYKHTISLVPHEMSEFWSREDVKFNPDIVKAGMATFQDHARKKFYDDEVWTFLKTNPTSYDGIALFSASHTNAAGTFDNLGTAFDGTNHLTIINEALDNEHSYQLPNGHVIDVKYTKLFCAGADARGWREWTGDQRRTYVADDGTYDGAGTVVGAGSMSNQASGIEVVVVDEFASGQYFFGDGRAPWKSPLLLARESGDPRLVTMDGPTDSLPFMENMIASSYEQSWGVGVGLHDFVYGNLTAI